MRRSIISWTMLFCLSLIVNQTHADISPAQIARAQFEIHQMWALSKNYYYGTSVPKDKMMALAWQMVYASVLPKSYPGVNTLLEVAKKKLSASEVTSAHNKSLELKSKFNLNFKLTERELFQTFHSDKKKSERVERLDEFVDLDMFLEEVSAFDPAIEKSYRKKIKSITRRTIPQTIVFGQLIINGTQPVQEVSVNHPLEIDEGGYFLALGGHSPLIFQLSGFDKQVATFSSDEKEVNLSRLYLNELPEKKKSSIVGSVSPEKAINDVDVVLKIKDQYERREPWFNALEPITILPNGQFYASGLSPTQYELIISYHDKTYKQVINLNPGMVKTLVTTDLSK